MSGSGCLTIVEIFQATAVSHLMRGYRSDSLIYCISSKLTEIRRVGVFEETVILQSVSFDQRLSFLTTALVTRMQMCTDQKNTCAEIKRGIFSEQ